MIEGIFDACFLRVKSIHQVQVDEYDCNDARSVASNCHELKTFLESMTLLSTG